MDANKTLCGYSWSDVYTALSRSIGNGDMKRSQRWAAELLCSETGISRLEAILLAIWSEHVGSALAQWPAVWHTNIAMLRNEWLRAGGDNRKFRNTPAIRHKVAECVGYLVVAAKRPRPSIPKSTDVFKEADAVKTRLRSGGASQDQPSTQRVWDTREDAPTLRTLGNELEAAIRTSQTSRALFWLVWILTLDSQKTRPVIKERAPATIQGKARKSLAWYVLAIFKDMADRGLDANRCINQILDCTMLVWMRLGAKYRREVFATVVVMLCERVKSASIEVRQPIDCVDNRPIRSSMEDIDSVYEEIARDMKVIPSDAVVVPGLAGAGGGKPETFKKQQKRQKDRVAAESTNKMEAAYDVMRKMYGMDDED
jgi:hypothetical protein